MDRQKRFIDATASRAGHYAPSEQLHICRLVLLEFLALRRMLIIHIHGGIPQFIILYSFIMVFGNIVVKNYDI
jgi:hypothetical protein